MQGPRKIITPDQVKDDPYINDKVYPVGSILSCSFLDSYIQAFLRNYNVMLPGKPGISRNIYMSDVHNEVTTCMDKIAERLTNISNKLNINDLDILKSTYKEYSKKHDEIVQRQLKDILGQNFDPTKLPEDKRKEFYKLNSFYDMVSSCRKKEAFIKAIGDKYYEDIVSFVDLYNNQKGRFVNFFIEKSYIICVSKNKPLLNNQIAKNIANEYELQFITSQGNYLLDKYKKEGLNYPYIYLSCTHLLINIKNRPISTICFKSNKPVDEYTTDDLHITPSYKFATDIPFMDSEDGEYFDDEDDWDDFDDEDDNL